MDLHFGFATSTEICQNIGARLRTHRLAQNLSQTELAQKAGVSTLTVFNLESKGTVTCLSLIQVAQALGLAEDLAGLFQVKPLSIAMMEAAAATPKRASSKRYRRHAVAS